MTPSLRNEPLLTDEQHRAFLAMLPYVWAEPGAGLPTRGSGTLAAALDRALGD